jgi:Protein of unknown function (DUF3631)
MSSAEEHEIYVDKIIELERNKRRQHKAESGAQRADDWLVAFAKKSNEALAKRAAEKQTTPLPNEKALVEALARKGHTEYDRMRVDVAKTLGIRVGTLDDKVEAVHKRSSDQGSAIVVEDTEPWAEPIDGAVLLDEMSKAMTGHIAMKETEADTIALWCLYSHAFDLFPVAPRLGIRAATAECGKTETLRRLKRFVNRPLECDGLTAAVFFRVIDAAQPTFLLDELDNMLPEDKSAMLGAMNSGYSRKGRQLRCIGDKNEVRAFRTFAPFVYAMVGKPTGTFDSRTIAIELRRATPEKARTLLSLEDEDEEDKRLSNLGRKAARWAADNRDELAKIRPDMGALVNRPAMNWRPLYAVAELAGGDWPKRARKAAEAAARARSDHDIKVELIIDIKALMDADPQAEAWASAMLADQLAKMEGRPWGEFGKSQKPITQNTIARMLKPFNIVPDYIGPEHSRCRGYLRSQFEEVFAAYATPPPSHNCATVQNAMDVEQVGDSQLCSATEGGAVGETQKPASSLGSAHLNGCKGGLGPPGNDEEVF